VPASRHNEDGLRKACNIVHLAFIDGEKVAASKRLSVINPATGKQLAAVPDVDRALLNKAISDARNAFSGWALFRLDAGKQY
jgi:acyl-CoA reductase-like NAD-dependent aldehyde dehydrogenase